MIFTVETIHITFHKEVLEGQKNRKKYPDIKKQFSELSKSIFDTQEVTN